MEQPILRGEQTDEYNVYLYVKSDNDYRNGQRPQPLHLWDQLDFGELDIVKYEKIVDSIKQLFEAKGYNKYILDPHFTLFGEEDRPFLYLVKYGDEIPWADQRKLWKLNLTPAEVGEENPDYSEYGIVIWGILNNIPASIAIDPRFYQSQQAIPQLAAAAGAAGAVGGKRRKTRRLRTKRRMRLRSRSSRRRRSA